MVVCDLKVQKEKKEKKSFLLGNEGQFSCQPIMKTVFFAQNFSFWCIIF
jgi:hypothetical protein